MSQPYYVLEIRYPDGVAETHEIYDERRILGRSKVKADLHIGDKKASGRHAELTFRDGQLAVKDMGSTNGTFFETHRMEGSFGLQPGQGFKVGDSQVRLMAIHGLAVEDDAKTMVGAPAWLDDVQPSAEDSTKALDASELAALMEKDAQESRPAPAAPLVEPEPEPAAPGGWSEAPDKTRALPIDQILDIMFKEEVARRDRALVPKPSPASGYPDQGGYPDQSGYDQGGYDQGGYDQGGYDQPAAGGYDDYYAPPAESQGHAEPAWSSSGGPIRVHFGAEGKDMLKGLILHMFLVPLTLFIYYPWFVVRARKLIYEHTTIEGTPRGRATLEFRGTGGQLFIIGLHALLIPLTLYIYTPWFIMKLLRFTLDNSVARAEDGTEYQLTCSLQPGKLLKFMLLNMLINLLTLNFYTPWFICKMARLFAEHTQLTSQRRPVASFSFDGTGGSLFGTWLLGFFLTMITFGIYWFWFQAKLIKWFQEHTEVASGQHRWRGSFAGAGGENFKINILFFLLLYITLGIYFFWYQVNSLRWRWNNSALTEVR